MGSNNITTIVNNSLKGCGRKWSSLNFNLFEGAGNEPREKHNEETNSLEKEQKEHFIELNFT